MDYDKADIPATYDKARALAPETRRLWQDLLSLYVKPAKISLVIDLGCGTAGWQPNPAARRIMATADYSDLAEQFHALLWRNYARRLTQNRLALVGEESVSVVTGGSGCRVQPGDPTHAHLHHRQ